MTKKLVVVLALAFVLALVGCTAVPMSNPVSTAAQRVENAGDAAVSALQGTPQPDPIIENAVTALSGCKMVVATQVVVVPIGSINEQGEVCNSGGNWGTAPEPSTLTNIPSGELYARTVESVDGWQRIREGVSEGEYFPWTYLTRIGCDRPVSGQEVEWDHPTLLNLYAETGDLTCQVEIARDVDSSTNWKVIGAEMDPYDSALRGPDGQNAGPRLAWFLGSNGGVISINGQQDFVLDISVCTTCTVPTDINATGTLLPEQWSAHPSDTTYNTHHAAIVYPFERNVTDTITYVIRLKKGQQAVLWQGTLVE